MPDYQPKYNRSHALLIGIDQYPAAYPPLSTAVKGVKELANLLRDELGFDNIITLEDAQAGRQAILSALTDNLANPDIVGRDDRVIVYFAGHGTTYDTAAGEIGYLVPADVVAGSRASLLAMNDLTRLSNQMYAKHVLFLLDACFSGYATTRSRLSGKQRQIEDYLTRPARQVITAGMREQEVSDAWGPGGHSLFTGFLIDGLKGNAPMPGGILRTFHLAVYLQDAVAQHSQALQTPQYASLMGNQGGDFILRVQESEPPDTRADWQKAIEEDDPEKRISAVWRLRELAESGQVDEAVDWLTELTDHDHDSLIRRSAQTVLGELLPEVKVIDKLPERLARALSSADADTRYYAIDQAQALLNDPTCSEAVRELLDEMMYDDPEPDVRRRAGKALREVSAPPPPRPEPIVAEPDIIIQESEPEPTIDIDFILPPPFEWVPISAGHVDIKRTTFDVQPFYMAKYPTTYAQFQVFVEAEDGFHNSQWWDGLAADNKHKSATGDQRWKIANHPRERVSWYHAVAYTRWLSEKLGEEVRLPTEWEWQWAAAGEDGRTYPWGEKKPNKNLANFNENVGKTTPVDAYPNGASPFGLLDMSGSVWEWCLNEYEIPSEFSINSSNRRVLRGGSWYDTSNDLRAALREWLNPDGTFYFFGFRCALSYG